MADLPAPRSPAPPEASPRPPFRQESPSSEPPRGTVVFLFTDIEGSTRRWQRFPGAMASALARHDALLRQAIEGHGGHVFKTVGDAFCAAFAAAPDAVAAALSAQRALAAEPWGEPRPLRVRMALHAGRAEARDADYFGPPLNRVARLLAAGHGGQALLSLAAAELSRDELPDGSGLRDLGEHRLKDLERPERVYQLVHPDLPTDFPPLASLDRRPHNLPVQPTPLVGREREIGAVRELLERSDVRLLTLTGPGGTGKTRLGLQVAAELVDTFAHGACFVPLASISDPELVASTIAATVGVQEAGGRTLLDTLKEALRDQELLLLLDNFEQVTAAASIVADLLAACPALRVLVTSRAALHLRAEREFPVPPLRLPDPRRRPAPEQLSQYEAVRLFVERAVAVRPDFAVTNENAPAVAEICHRLDGLPLAIELAAARDKLLAPEALLARLGQRLRVLTGGARDLPERQQTLRGAIAWSHDLLTPEEQALFRRLGVLAGCSLEAAEAVCNPDGELDVFEGLCSLVDKCLLVPQAGPEDEPRFGMLETIREYALERLEASGEAEATRRAHATHFLAWTEEAAPGTWGVDQARWLDRLEAELDNLRAALAWAIELRETQMALTLAISLEKLWDVRGYLSEGRRWLERGLELPMEGIRAETRAQATSNAGSLAQVQGDLAGARALQERTLTILREVDSEGGRRGTAHVLNRLGIIAFLQDDRDAADALQEEALERFHELGDTAAAASVLNNLGVTAHDRGDLARARVLYEEALALQREAGDTQSIALYLGNLGEVVRDQRDHAVSAAYFREALELWVQLKDAWNASASLDGLAGLAAGLGRSEAAARLFGAAAAMRDAVGAPLAANERADHERYLDRVREALGAAAFATAWEAGRTRSLEEAISEALALADELATSGVDE